MNDDRIGTASDAILLGLRAELERLRGRTPTTAEAAILDRIEAVLAAAGERDAEPFRRWNDVDTRA